MKYESVCTLLMDLHNKILAPSATPITLEQVPIKALNIDEHILETANNFLKKSPYMSAIYIERAERNVNPMTDLVVDSYLEYLGVL